MNEVIHRRVCFLQALRNGKGNASVRQILRSLVVQYKGMRQHETHQAEAHYWAEKTFSNCISSATYRYGEFVVCFDEILHSSHHFPGRFKHFNEYMGEESNSQTKTSLFHGFQLVMSELIGFEGICVTMTDTHFTMFDVIEDNAGSPLNQRLIPWADLHYFTSDDLWGFFRKFFFSSDEWRNHLKDSLQLFQGRPHHFFKYLLTKLVDICQTSKNVYDMLFFRLTSNEKNTFTTCFFLV